MAEGHQVDKSWMWHPFFTEEQVNTAGLFVHFKREFFIENDPPVSLPIYITADTRYKLYVNRQLVAFGPVKGDTSLWFYDEADIGPYLQSGQNHVTVRVLRFFHATSYAVSFPRSPSGGLRIIVPGPEGPWNRLLQSSTLWRTAIDHSTTLRIDQPEDDFLHIYENRLNNTAWEWFPAKLLEYQVSTGNAPPLNLSPRLIPSMRRENAYFCAVHNVRSSLPHSSWHAQLIHFPESLGNPAGLSLPPQSSHCIDLEVPQHMTGFIHLRFKRPSGSGSTLRVTYAESYEDTPVLVPYLRRKGNRRDSSKDLFGPQDIYHFEGVATLQGSDYHEDDIFEVFTPFHFRTFRFIRVNIDVGSSELVLHNFEVETVNYPLDVRATFKVSGSHELSHNLWETSVRTLANCMHDCYEDCPFYEQLQYAMDTRSSALFTYYVSGDDRLARQAIIQLHNSFQARTGLTSSRAPSHKAQTIPHFSLFWICMLRDHLDFFGDKVFLASFVPVVDAILNYFHSRLDQNLGLVVSDTQPGTWNFVDWTEQWRPYGIPPAANSTGISTYTNHLYTYALKNAAALVSTLGRPSIAEEYMCRAGQLVQSLQHHCFNGQFFTDSLASAADKATSYSVHNQVWAVLSGAATGKTSQEIMRQSLDPASRTSFVQTSISMSFYTLRALSKAGGKIYEEHFHRFWDPWTAQLAAGLTTWEEDGVSQRSDCHAWGSAPIYEFMAEVVGLRPAAPGWSAILFQPRLVLYRELEATVPLPMIGSEPAGAAHVSWSETASGDILVTLRFEMSKPMVIPVHVNLPSHPARVMDSTEDLTFIVKSTSEEVQAGRVSQD